MTRPPGNDHTASQEPDDLIEVEDLDADPAEAAKVLGGVVEPHCEPVIDPICEPIAKRP